MKILSLILILLFSFNSAQEVPELETGWYFVSSEETQVKRTLDKTNETFFILPEKIVGLENFQNYLRLDTDYSMDGKEMPMLIMQLDSVGAKKWETATTKALNKKLAFIINNKLVYTPTIVHPISGGLMSVSREEYSKEDLEEQMRILKFEMDLLER